MRDRNRLEFGLVGSQLEFGTGSIVEAPAHPLEGALREQVGARGLAAYLHSPNPLNDPSTNRGVPFCIRVTMNQVLGIADDADLRAQMLHWSATEMPSGGDLLRRMRRLHEAALALRNIAADLADGWAPPDGRS